jgi:hypothetical protein
MGAIDRRLGSSFSNSELRKDNEKMGTISTNNGLCKFNISAKPYRTGETDCFISLDVAFQLPEGMPYTYVPDILEWNMSPEQAKRVIEALTAAVRLHEAAAASDAITQEAPTDYYPDVAPI